MQGFSTPQGSSCDSASSSSSDEASTSGTVARSESEVEEEIVEKLVEEEEIAPSRVEIVLESTNSQLLKLLERDLKVEENTNPTIEEEKESQLAYDVPEKETSTMKADLQDEEFLESGGSSSNQLANESLGETQLLKSILEMSEDSESSLKNEKSIRSLTVPGASSPPEKTSHYPHSQDGEGSSTSSEIPEEIEENDHEYEEVEEDSKFIVNSAEKFETEKLTQSLTEEKLLSVDDAKSRVKASLDDENSSVKNFSSIYEEEEREEKRESFVKEKRTEIQNSHTSRRNGSSSEALDVESSIEKRSDVSGSEDTPVQSMLQNKEMEPFLSDQIQLHGNSNPSLQEVSKIQPPDKISCTKSKTENMLMEPQNLQENSDAGDGKVDHLQNTLPSASRFLPL